MTPDERAEFEREMLCDPARALAVYHEMGMGPMAHEALQALRIRHLESHARIPDRSVTKRVPWWGRTRSRLVVVVVAVVIALLAVTVTNIEDSTGPPPTRAPAEGFRLLGPVGTVDPLPAQFSWTSHARADQYRIEIFDDAHLFFTTLTNDTVLIVGLDDIASRGMRAGYWRVVPLDAHGSELPASERAPLDLSLP
jgi:hypothetical protein